MKDGFNITILDNFFDKNTLNKLQNALPILTYSSKYNYIHDISHIWFSAPAEDYIENILKENCEKILNKKLKINFCSYTLLSTVEPLPHCDLSEDCDYQIIVYIKGNENLHKGTGFYVGGEDKYELNTHVGFRENRAVVWHANTWHTPMNWSSDDKSKRYSVICQLKEIK